MLMKKVVAILLGLTLLLGLGTTAGAAGTYTPGTYSGAAMGKGGDVCVDVTFSENAIEAVTITSHAETPGISDPAIEEIPAEIVAYQSLGVDTITGCTITCDAILDAVAQAVEQAGGDVEALRSVKVEKVLNDAVIDLAADVVIVGGGAAGMAAAVAAGEDGAHVVLVEKMGSIGGNAIISGGWIENIEIEDSLKAKNNEGYQKTLDEFFAAGPQDDQEKEVWDALTAEYEAYLAKNVDYVFDSDLFLVVEYHRIEGGDVSGYLSYPQYSAAFDQWMTDAGCEWHVNSGIVGYQWPRWNTPKGYTKGNGYFAFLQKAIEEKNLNVEIYLNTPATELTTDEAGRVTGIVAQARTGETYNIAADKGVILCTGGFSANGKMLVEYNTMWEGMTENINSDNSVGNTGDGIVMAQKLGALTAAMDSEMLFPLAGAYTGSTEAIVGGNSLYVNKEGRRFVDETADRFAICRAAFEQPDEMMYIVSDAKNSGVKDGYTIGGFDVNVPIQHGELLVADTLEELAEKMDADPAVLEATVAKHNEACKTFVDEEFGRSIYEDGMTIDTAPFYAYASAPAAHITIGGLIITDDGEVVRDDGTLIEGLYAAGEVACGYCGISAFAYGMHTAHYVMETAK